MATVTVTIPITEKILPTSFILSHGGLCNYPDRHYAPNDGYDNELYFKVDLVEGRLNAFIGSFVAYQHGTLAGAHGDMLELYKEARAYYGGSSLGVFKVPRLGENLHDLRVAGTI